jgi:hypothetical protein
MSQSGFGEFVGKPVPAVWVDDVRRVWSFLTEQARGTGVNVKLLSDLCAPNANILAVYFRATLITALLQQGQIDRWRDGNSLLERVFEVAASFPLPKGLENVDLDAVVAALN